MPTKNNQGVYVVIASIAIQLCLGIAYIWSVFQTGIANSIFAGNNAAAGLTFSLLLSMLAVGSIIGGKLSVKYSTRFVVITGGIIISIGFFISSFVTAQTAWLLWISYGAIGGIGMGFTYSTTIAIAQKWFPNKKGLVTGIIVSALGLGGVLFTPIIEKLITLFGGTGVGEPKTFMVVSIIFFIVCTIGGIFMKNPPPAPITTDPANKQTQNITKDYRPSEILKSPKFYLITITFMLACMGGLMMIGFAKPIAEAKGLVETATIGVLLISMFNSIGRLFWGTVSDKLGRINTIMILLVGTALLSLTVNIATGYLIFILIGCIGFFYGGFLSIFPSLTADIFGPKNMAVNYGLVMIGFGLGAILSSQIAGHYKNIASQNIDLMFPAFAIAAVCALAGIICIFILKIILKKE